MTRLAFAVLVARALFELLAYDVVLRTAGFQRTLRRLRGPSGAPPGGIEDVCRAVQLAACLYWKPVLCLQRSFCIARLLRVRGVSARLVVGYRPEPFFSHAWVEVAGRVVNDSPVYQQRLRILYTA